MTQLLQRGTTPRGARPLLTALTALGLALAPAFSATPVAAQAPAPTTVTFEYTGLPQTWTVPTGVTSATFEVSGAQGGAGAGGFGAVGRGGRASATLAVTPGVNYQINVGGAGAAGGSADSVSGGAGGVGGGGRGGDAVPGGSLNGPGGGGGGASDVRSGSFGLADRLLVGGGGGGGGGSAGGGAGGGGYYGGGAAGGCWGGGGRGGTQSAGGAGGVGWQPDNGILHGFDGAAGDAGTGGAGGAAFGCAGGGNTSSGAGGGTSGSNGTGGHSSSRFNAGGGGGGSGFGPAGVAFGSGVQAGNGRVVISYISPDATAPTASPSQAPAANGAGWNTGTVTVSWNWADNPGGVGLDPAACPTSSTSGGEGALTLSATCKDLAGNQGSASHSVKVDTTRPTISAAATSQPNANGWYSGPVSVHFTCADGLSGIPSDACPAEQVLSAEGAAVSSAARTVADAAGNTSAPSNVATVKLDQTAPVVGVTGVATNGAYPLGAVPVAGCTTTDALSGVAAAATLQVTGGTAAGVGSFTATCGGATDQAGNTASASATYTVGYGFGGFLAPVDNPNTVNTGRAGRTYPVKWRLTGAAGAPVSALSAVTGLTYQATACGAFGAAPDAPLEAEATGATALRYDGADNHYVYTWKTPGAAGCYTLLLTLDSGQVQPAYFKLN